MIWPYLLLLVLAAFYGILMLVFLYGWERLKKPAEADAAEIKFTVIIPARNEEQNIAACLQSILGQNYPPHLFNIILVDDASEDATAELAKKTSQAFPAVNLRVISLLRPLEADFVAYKKRAIESAISVAGSDWVITTDADCTAPPNWLKKFANIIEQQQPVMVCGPVTFHAENLFQRLQHLEFLGLIGTGAASISLNKPTMCNGANLAYSKAAFAAVDGFEGNRHLASGDDEFLLHKLAKHFPGKISFLKDAGAAVKTHPAKNFTSFLSQRRRWVSKSRTQLNSPIALVILPVFLLNFLMICCGILLILFPQFCELFLAAVLIKAIVEMLFLGRVSSFFGYAKLILLFPLAFIFNIIYVSFIPFLANAGGYNWKGRMVR